MAFWNRKKKKEIPIVPPPCKHHWKDFPWYWHGEWTGRGVNLLQFSVYEPYVCIHCKERQDKKIFERNSFYPNRDEAQAWVDDFIERHKKYFESRVIIEDMIADMQLVDREYLEIYASLKNHGVDKAPQLTI